MLIIEAITDMPMQIRDAPSPLRIPTHTEFIIRKNEQNRKGRTYSMQRSTFSPCPTNDTMGSATRYRMALVAIERTRMIRNVVGMTFSAESISSAPMWRAIAADAPTAIPVPIATIIE